MAIELLMLTSLLSEIFIRGEALSKEHSCWHTWHTEWHLLDFLVKLSGEVLVNS